MKETKKVEPQKVRATRLTGIVAVKPGDGWTEHRISIQLSSLPKKHVVVEIPLLWDYDDLQKEVLKVTGHILWHPGIECLAEDVRGREWKAAVNEFMATGKAPEVLTARKTRGCPMSESELFRDLFGTPEKKTPRKTGKAAKVRRKKTGKPRIRPG